MYDKKEFPIFVGTKLKKCMIESERQQIIELIKKEVIPAIGCTEPIAVALCVAKAAETLGVNPEKLRKRWNRVNNLLQKKEFVFL